jgi:hypothetical protein
VQACCEHQVRSQTLHPRALCDARLSCLSAAFFLGFTPSDATTSTFTSARTTTASPTRVLPLWGSAFPSRLVDSSPVVVSSCTVGLLTLLVVLIVKTVAVVEILGVVARGLSHGKQPSCPWCHPLHHLQANRSVKCGSWCHPSSTAMMPKR